MKQIKYYTCKALSFFGIGVLYLLVCFPDVRRWKIGVTGLHIGSKKRAKQVSDSLPGILIPVFFVVVPGYYQLEAFLHWMCKPFHAPFRRGDGHSEIFYFQAAVYAFCVMAAMWIFEIAAIEWALGVDWFWPFVGSILKINFAG
jgi:hypothetical protein